MPLREYKCNKCGSEIEVLETIRDNSRNIIAITDYEETSIGIEGTINGDTLSCDCGAREVDGEIKRIASMYGKHLSWSQWHVAR